LYQVAGNKEGEYKASFQFSSFIVDTIPKHTGFATMTPKMKAMFNGFREHNRTIVVPRLEQLKPQLRSDVHRTGTLRPGAARIQASNLPDVDWAASLPTGIVSGPTPANYLEANPTVAAQMSMWAAHNQPTAADDPFAAADGGDPFAASNMFQATPAAPPMQAPFVMPSQSSGLPALPPGALRSRCVLDSASSAHSTTAYCTCWSTYYFYYYYY
jgi:hypothetical protein